MCQPFASFLFFVYQVRYWNNGEEESSSKVKVAGNETSARLRGLKSNVAYYTAVRAYNSAGAGPFSTTVNATTKKTRTYAFYSDFLNGKIVVYGSLFYHLKWTTQVTQHNEYYKSRSKPF